MAPESCNTNYYADRGRGTVDLILDVGCGLGTLSDYLHGPQRAVYTGVTFQRRLSKRQLCSFQSLW